jgi:hypothetical protein
VKEAVTSHRQSSSQACEADVDTKLSHNCFSFKHIAVLTPDAYDFYGWEVDVFKRGTIIVDCFQASPWHLISEVLVFSPVMLFS